MKEHLNRNPQQNHSKRIRLGKFDKVDKAVYKLVEENRALHLVKWEYNSKKVKAVFLSTCGA